MSTLLNSLRRSRALAIATLVATASPLIPLHDALADSSTSAAGATDLGSGGISVPQSSAAAPAQGIASVDATGIAHASYSFKLPPARGSVQPTLALGYSSNGGDGDAGFGWSLNLPTIERRGPSRTSVPSFHDQGSTPDQAWDTYDTFTFEGRPLVPVCAVTDGVCAGGAASGETMPSLTSGSGWWYYRLQVDDGSALRFFLSSDKFRWVVQTKSGETMEFGVPLDVQMGLGIDADVPSGKVYRWKLTRRYDNNRASGVPTNPIAYLWNGPGGTLSDIYDTRLAASTGPVQPAQFEHHVHLTWSANPNVHTNPPVWRSTHAAELLTQVDVTSWQDTSTSRVMVRRYDLAYAPQSITVHHAQLIGITEEGQCATSVVETNELLPAVTNCPTLPSTYMTYSNPAGFPAGAVVMNGSTNLDVRSLIDVTGDGLPDIIQPVFSGTTQQPSYTLFVNHGASEFTTSIMTMPAGYDPSMVTGANGVLPGDWLGDGRPDFAAFSGAPWRRDTWNGASDNSADPPSVLGITVFAPKQTSGGWTWVPALSASPQWDLRVQNDHAAMDILTCMPVDVNGDGLIDCYSSQQNWKGDDSVGNYHFLGDGFLFAKKNRAGAISFPLPPGSVIATDSGYPLTVPSGNSSAIQAAAAWHNLVKARAEGKGWDTKNDGLFWSDMDGDGLVDLVTLPVGQACVSAGTATACAPIATRTIAYFRGHGDGHFGEGGCIASVCDPALAIPTRVISYDALLPETVPNDWPDSEKLPINPAEFRVYFHDLNGDGLSDMVMAMKDQVDVFFNQDGVAFALPIQLFPGHDIPEWNMEIDDNDEVLKQHTQIMFADMNGSGVDDLVLVGAQVAYVDFFRGNTANTPNLLLSIENGLGAKTSFKYASTAMLLGAQPVGSLNHPAVGTPQPVQVVVQVEETNGLAGPNFIDRVTTYDYADPVYDARERQFRGYRTVTATHVGSTRTKTTYLISNCPVDGGAPCTEGVDNVYETLRALPLVVETSDSTGATFLSTSHMTYAARPIYAGADGRTVRLVYGEQTDTYLYDASAATNGSATQPALADVDDPTEPKLVTAGTALALHATSGVAHLRSTRHLDNHGNVDTTTNYGHLADLGNTGADTPITTATAYLGTVGPVGSWMWKPNLSSVYYGTPTAPGTTSRREAFGYDVNGNLTDVRAGLSGTLALSRHHEDATAAIAPLPPTQSKDGTITLVHMVLDPFGNATHVESPDGGCLDYGYDAKYAQFATTVTHYVGSASSGCGPTALKTMTTFDRGFGLPMMTSGAGNSVSSTTYDSFGRVSAIYEAHPTLPGVPSTLPSAMFDYPKPVVTPQGTYRLVHAQHIVGTSGTAGVYASAWSFVDGFGQTLATLTQADSAAGDGGNWIASGQSLQTTNGLVVRAYASAFWGGTDPKQFPYAATPTQPSETYSYDAFGRMILRLGTDATTPLAKIVRHALSTEVWDAEDLRAGGVHANTPSTITRDGFGRNVRTASVAKQANGQLDTVTTTATYLATGEVAELDKTHSAGSDVFRRTMTYDSLGRMVSNTEPNSSGLMNWRYAYDNAGRLVGTSDARGCGENIFYDTAGRVIAEDFSPCQKSQALYTAPNLATGDGTEAFYQYDGADTINGGIGQAAAVGRLTSTSDRGAHTRLYYDGRGRTVQVTRQLAKPDVPTAALASRYATTWFSTTASYDLANRIASQSTGADAAGLMDVATGTQSQVTPAYSLRGLVTQVQSSYGTLLQNARFDADGSPLTMTYGDAAKTTATYQYQTVPSTPQMTPFKSLQRFTVSRRGGPWVAYNTTSYPAPSPSEPTTQSILIDDFFTYDYSGNPTEIDDFRPAAEWPAGAKPVSKRTFTYDDNYRVKNASYATGSDTQALLNFGATNAVPSIARAKRVQSQTFAYDWLGNTTSTSDDANAFFDRSLGTITNGTSAPNQLVSAKGAGTNALGAIYDAAGNTASLVVQRTDAGCLTSAGCTQRYDYTWDEVGRLSRARRWDYASVYPGGIPVTLTAAPTSAPAADLSFAYDASNNRVSKSITTTTGTLYDAEIFPSLRLNHAAWSGSDYQHDSTTEGVYLLVGGAALGRVAYSPHDWPTLSSGKQHVLFEITDHLGSTSVVVDKESSEVVEKSTYQAYGAPDSDYQPSRWDSFREDYRFTGKEDDAEVGLTYFGQRYYSPGLGRWLSPDPLAVHGLGADLNPYAYVQGHVGRASDPFGLSGTDDDETDQYGSLSEPVMYQGTLMSPGSGDITWEFSTPVDLGEIDADSSGTGSQQSEQGGAPTPAASPPSRTAVALSTGTLLMDLLFNDPTKDFIQRPPQGPACFGSCGDQLGEPGAVLITTLALDRIKLPGAKAASEEPVTMRCFSAGTLVAMCDGSEQPIETLRVNDRVSSRTETGDVECHDVVRTFERIAEDRAVVVVNNDGASEHDEIHTTLGHRFWVNDRGWTQARALESGDELRLLSGRTAHVLGTSVERGAGEVYNLEVEGSHTYFVGRSQTLVHNEGCGDPGPYKRPSGATTPAQRASVQGKPCVDCGEIAPRMNADHKDAIVKEFYRNGGEIDRARMQDVSSVQPQCPTCSNRQGGFLSSFSRAMKRLFGYD